MEGETVIAGVDTHKDVHVLCLSLIHICLSALGLIIFETAPTTQSTPRPESLFCRSKPVTPDSYTHLALGSTERTHSATAPAS